MNNKEGLKCMICGHDLIWDSDANAGDSYADYEEDEDAVISFFHCSHCGRSYDVIDPIKSEREGIYSSYWKDNVVKEG